MHISDKETGHREFMGKALTLANIAAEKGEVPVGALIIRGKDVVAGAFNQVESLGDPCAHAEILAIRQAADRLANWRLESCSLYVTLEPCPMCAGAIRLARIPLVVFGASDPRMGGMGSFVDLSVSSQLGPVPRIIPGVLGEECLNVLKRFFADKRC